MREGGKGAKRERSRKLEERQRQNDRRSHLLKEVAVARRKCLVNKKEN